MRSWLGLAWKSVREDELASSVAGTNTARVKIIAFAVGAGYCGLAGSLYAQFMGSVSPSDFGFLPSLFVVTMINLGGVGTIRGAIAGAIILSVLPELFRFGAGKTTLLRSIMGLVPCGGGRIRFHDQELSGRPAHTRAGLGISIVPEGRGLLRQFTVEENLLVGAFSRTDSSQVRTDLGRIYQLFPRLSERRRQLAGSLSGGEGQMLALGRALMSRPRLLLMDEPSMGLMPVMVSEMFRTIASLRTEGISILLVEQNAKKALAVANRAAVLQLGRVVVEGRPHDLVANELVKKAYFGA